MKEVLRSTVRRFRVVDALLNARDLDCCSRAGNGVDSVGGRGVTAAATLNNRCLLRPVLIIPTYSAYDSMQ